MKTAHKIRINPTPEQVEYFKRACGSRRFIYNWGREQWEKQYQAYKAEQETVPEQERTRKPPSAFALKKQFNAIREQAYPWTYEVTKCVVEGAFDDLSKAYDNFFAGRADYPIYKKKGKSHESFYLSNDKFTVGSHWISIPGLGRFVLDQRQITKGRGKLQRKLSKKQKTQDPQTKRSVTSSNYEKQRLKVARKHQQIANMRRDVQHKFTTELARTCGVIGIEDLGILGMMANRKLARAIADAAMGQLLRFLKTKITNAGGELFIASRWFPSTKRCSCCGHIKKRMPLKHRTYQCLVCGLVMDRDVNAALNLLWFATEQLRQLHAA
jgi:IS605 OrfB family transposase